MLPTLPHATSQMADYQCQSSLADSAVDTGTAGAAGLALMTRLRFTGGAVPGAKLSYKANTRR